MRERENRRRFRWRRIGLVVAFTLVGILVATSEARGHDHSKSEQPVRRQGVFMGLDPGLSLRVQQGGTPLYARLDLRLGGCISSWFHLGADWRGDLLVTVVDGAAQKRHEIGPVATFFMVEGWFARVFVHLAGIQPWIVTAGGQTGYEFSLGRFTAGGLALGADTDIPVDGQSPMAYSFSLSIYLTAYDLGRRMGRDFSER